ncbi:nuclear transport factor 2 family protein [Sciscionella sediminilitoris]|uniref:nuclear transport factor 2 family protein n=1 Tax=Sciscionella sediminilitoris TaxID=1445613 RepID=UPI0005624158|nr:nuclear transport factor 2 family protein [Sciscionella sp. SE31]
METELGERAIRSLRCLEAGDHAGMRALCTESATVWHDDGTGERTLDEQLTRFASLATTVDSVRFELVRQFTKANEVLQQQVLHFERADGQRGGLHATMYFRFTGGLIERIEEFAHA